MTEMVAMALLSATATFIGLHFGRRWERERCAGICDEAAECERSIRADEGAFWRLTAANRLGARIREGRP